MIRRRGGAPEDMGHGAGVPRYNRRRYRTKGDLSAYTFATAALARVGKPTDELRSMTHDELRHFVIGFAEKAGIKRPLSVLYEAEWILWDHEGSRCLDLHHAA